MLNQISNEYVLNIAFSKIIPSWVEELFDCTRDGVILTNSSGYIESINKAACDITGYTLNDLIHKPITILKPKQRRYFIPLKTRKILQSLQSWQGELTLANKNGKLYTQYMTIIPMERDYELQGYIYLFYDLSIKKQQKRAKRQQSIHDTLTHLNNRQFLIQTLQTRDAPTALLSIDLDNFKQINDTHGHVLGDELLKAVAKRIKKHCLKEDLLCRMGGDEYVILKRGNYTPQELTRLANEINVSFHKPFKVGDSSLYITASIGILNIPDPKQNTEHLIAAVDIALNEAKKSGKDCVTTYTDEMSLKMRQNLELENEIRTALAKNEIGVHYQPQYSLKTHEITGVEALARWQRKDRIWQPNEFIPVAETSRVIIPLGKAILKQACHDIHKLNQKRAKPISLAVNVSAVQLKYSDFVSTVKSILKESKFPPQLLDLEVTENMVMDDVNFYLPILKAISDLGVKITLDDFGTGYSSLNYLHQFPLKKIKVDKSFLNKTTRDEFSYPILKTIIDLANIMGLATVAEGVENTNQLAQIKGLECDTFQGFLFAKPMPFETLVKITRRKKE